MIRFLPDTWWDAFLRFFLMAAPDANVYVEIPAPDIRLACLLLAAAGCAIAWRRVRGSVSTNLALLATLSAATVLWLLTTGNGRYFVPMLICAGPLFVGLVWILPLTRLMRFAIVAGVLAGQLFVLSQQPPWDMWTWVRWREAPYFQVNPPKQYGSLPVTYVSISTISYSLIDPQFSPGARWFSAASGNVTPRDAAFADRFLARAQAEGPLVLLAPTAKGQVLPDGQPSPDVREALDKLLAVRKLHIVAGQRCELLPSRGLLHIGRRGDAPPSSTDWQVGFWACPLAYDPQAKKEETQVRLEPWAQQVYDRLEGMCPRFFHSGGAGTLEIPAGWVRYYDGSDTRVYVLRQGDVYYKFWRSLNAKRIGTAQEIISGAATVDCNAIRGDDRAWRSGR